MKVTVEQTEKLLSGNHSFSQLGLSMMMTRMKKTYLANPSQAALEKSTNELNLFFDKFKSIAEKDFGIIEQL